MSQPKLQLSTFATWAGRGSDISYYLNSHHVDFHSWTVGDCMRPIVVTAAASHGVAASLLGRPCEDTISLQVTWERPAASAAGSEPRRTGIATYTASWVAPKSDVHSQQRFHCMCADGEVSIDQAHRGYTVATDGACIAATRTRMPSSLHVYMGVVCSVCVRTRVI